MTTIDSITGATSSGWSFLGSGTNWYGEKPVQCGGKLSATSSASADLITAMQNVENTQDTFGVHGAKNSSFPGHV